MINSAHYFCNNLGIIAYIFNLHGCYIVSLLSTLEDIWVLQIDIITLMDKVNI